MRLLRTIQAAFADEVDGLGTITRVMSVADLFTLGNAVVGLFAVYKAAVGDIHTAAALIALSVVLDGTDGAAARLWGGGPLGPFLDTLADLLAFGIVPAVVMAVGLPDLQPWGFIAGALWLIASMLRLARFEVLREEETVRYYSGMTTTGAAVLLACLLLADVPALAVLIASGVLAFWMVSRIRTVKLTFWPLVWGALTLFPVFLDLVVPLPRTYVLASLFTGMSLYTFAGPFYILGRFGATPHPNAEAE